MTNNWQPQLPPPLKPGDLLRAIAPSGAVREFEAFQNGVEIWRRRGYRVELAANWNTKEGYLAGTDRERRQQLAGAWQDSNCRGILCARGGYGSARLLENWTWNFQPPISKWLIGFSDITGLLWSLAQFGISGVHGAVLTTLADEPEWSLDRLFNCVEGRPLAPLTGVGWGGGKISGRLLPANLTVATHLLCTSVLPSLDGTILALEDVTEAPYRIDRMLTQWRMSGAFQKIRGIALGRFSRCDPPQNLPSWTVEEVLRDRFSDLKIPIVSNLPFGHDGVNAALPVGQNVHLDADQGTLEF
ncbi:MULTISPECIES: S66 peptidase family protein [unclassified Coleofasciculus]|uniref:S66 peptidase family protein n=1 Tax=unclassified Coleofasciculus TaxID=2692782 RepID=UPI00187FF752|nr:MULTISPECIES: LD-carboxypeptidase [unclassified Coleofasciculus]MBE9126347.1 LD-carboxypeptidase [Coleofasciculus sp. LEGE 07081]MBE9147476.1 LD-carboxypeptidase [Coleofasciculus sp. LEGE 07092]